MRIDITREAPIVAAAFTRFKPIANALEEIVAAFSATLKAVTSIAAAPVLLATFCAAALAPVIEALNASSAVLPSAKSLLYSLKAARSLAENCLFIDGRLAAETFQVFCIVGNDTASIDRYTKEWLFTDAEADATQCSYKQTTFMANMIGSIMVNLFVNFCANQTNVLIPRDVPFMTEYTAETMYFKVIA